MAKSADDIHILLVYTAHMSSKSTAWLPRYARSAAPPSMRLTQRDRHILEAIHAYDGMLSFSQIQRLFFTAKSQTELRLRLLYQNKYLNRPNIDERRKVPEMIYWLDKNGAELVASLQGVRLKEFSWRSSPRWFQVEHDLAVNDFRLDIVEASAKDEQVELEVWMPEAEFWSYPDKISYRYQNKIMQRNIRPDGFFILRAGKHRIRYLLEIDRSTEDNPRFYREKILPGLAYLKSDAYEERFGHRSGRWLVVTTGKRRLSNMLRQAKRAKAAGLFYFSTYDEIKTNSIFHSLIWKRADREDSVPLLFLN